MIICKLYKYVGRDIKLAAFIIAVNPLTAGKYLAQLLLGDVFVFSETSYSWEKHIISPLFNFIIAENPLLTFSVLSAIILHRRHSAIQTAEFLRGFRYLREDG